MNRLFAIFTALSLSLSLNAQTYFNFGTSVSPEGKSINVDSHGIVVNGKHVIPVMGEVHFSRLPEKDWRREIQKMKAGGITIIASYIFWNHHEDEEGQWDWSGNKNLHKFLTVCKEESMPVVIRIGPFCHGEVYHGGFPDWIVDKSISDPKNYKLRSMAKGFIEATQRLYSNIYAQASDMLWKHGGPVVGVQIENECRGPWNYYMALKDMAVSIGFDVPFYTRTGWPKLNGNEEFGKMLPLYGDYADGFWDRNLTDMPGDYPKAFLFKDSRLSSVIATETFGNNQDTRMEKKDLEYPYLTCELGGGMTVAYHRRINMSGNEPFPLAVCKVGSGSNLPGYYMYHGGTNPYSEKHTMAECQASRTTAHNDMPYMSYEFQAPLGEMGQVNEIAYHQTRWFHQFLSDWGEELATLNVDSMSDHYARRGCFVFRNDYVRIINEQGGASVTLNGWKNGDATISSSSIQPFARTSDTIYFITIKGMKKYQISINSKTYSLKFDKPLTVAGKRYILLSPDKARTAFKIDGNMYYAKNGGILYKNEENKIVEEVWNTDDTFNISWVKTKDAQGLREVKKGADKVAEQPSEKDFDNAATYNIMTTCTKSDADDCFISIDYAADCARIYADGKLVEDNFWNGKPMFVRISDIIDKKAELKILPLKKDAPVYLQKTQKDILNNADGEALLKLNGMKIIHRKTIEF